MVMARRQLTHEKMLHGAVRAGAGDALCCCCEKKGFWGVVVVVAGGGLERVDDGYCSRESM